MVTDVTFVDVGVDVVAATVVDAETVPGVFPVDDNIDDIDEATTGDEAFVTDEAVVTVVIGVVTSSDVPAGTRVESAKMAKFLICNDALTDPNPSPVMSVMFRSTTHVLESM